MNYLSPYHKDYPAMGSLLEPEGVNKNDSHKNSGIHWSESRAASLRYLLTHG